MAIIDYRDFSHDHLISMAILGIIVITINQIGGDSMTKEIRKQLDVITRGILQTVPNSEAIYLFGSYAYGTPNSESDMDIYVVVPDSLQEHPIDIAVAIRKNIFKQQNIAMDILVGKSSVFNRRKNGPTLENTIAEEGMKIYAS